MRYTFSIPDEYYSKIKPSLKEYGYSTINEFLLDLIRHHFDDIPDYTHVTHTPKVIKTPEDAVKAVGAKTVTELPLSKEKQIHEKIDVTKTVGFQKYMR